MAGRVAPILYGVIIVPVKLIQTRDPHIIHHCLNKLRDGGGLITGTDPLRPESGEG